MTARWRSGGEIAPATAETEFSSGLFTAVSQVTSPVRSGTYALKFAGTASGYAIATLPTPYPTGGALRAYWLRDSDTMANATRILGLFPSSIDAHLANLRLRTDFRLEFVVNGVTLAISSFVVPLLTWFCLELWVDQTLKIVSTRYNHAEWARTTVAAFAGATADVGALYVGPDEAAPTGCNLYVDDMALNSLDGAYNNGWPGPCDGGVLTFRPNRTGAVSSWTPNGAPTIHECLDDLAPDASTTYITESAGIMSAGAALYFPTWPVEVPASCIQIGLIGSSPTPTTLSLAAIDPHELSTIFATPTTLTTGWQRRYPFLTLERAWDGSRRLLNNGSLILASGHRLQIVILRADSAPVTQWVTTLWMTVDFPLALAAAPISVSLETPTMLAQIVNA